MKMAASELGSSSHLLGAQGVNHPNFAPGVLIDQELVSAHFVSMLLSARFWDNGKVPRKSDNYFHRISFFRSRTPNDPSRELYEYRNPIVLDQELLTQRLLQGPLLQIEIDMINDWELREKGK